MHQRPDMAPLHEVQWLGTELTNLLDHFHSLLLSARMNSLGKFESIYKLKVKDSLNSGTSQNCLHFPAMFATVQDKFRASRGHSLAMPTRAMSHKWETGNVSVDIKCYLISWSSHSFLLAPGRVRTFRESACSTPEASASEKPPGLEIT